MINAQQQALSAALQWHIDVGADEALENTARSIIAHPDISIVKKDKAQSGAKNPAIPPSPHLVGAANLRTEAIKSAASAQTLDALRDAITAFEGLDIKKTATNMVFCDGSPQAPVMLIGEAPGADEDRAGRPFVGASGQLLDNILGCIDMGRSTENPALSVYITNILNWRPPGNRSPAPAEIEINLPFIERHIALVQPKLLILCGSVAAKALLGTEDSTSRLRGKWHDYTPRTAGIADNPTPIPAIATYHPSYLLKTPSQKRAVWQDMLALRDKKREMGLIPQL